jgi:glutaredoxin
MIIEKIGSLSLRGKGVGASPCVRPWASDTVYRETGARKVTPLRLFQISYGVKVMGNLQSPTPPKVTFYTKAGCHLCDDARDMLDEIAAQTTYELTEIDIRRDTELFERYRYRIPVIMINETLAVEGRVDYNELTHAFANVQKTLIAGE